MINAHTRGIIRNVVTAIVLALIAFGGTFVCTTNTGDSFNSGPPTTRNARAD
jgi:hypothetical protein